MDKPKQTIDDAGIGAAVAMGMEVYEQAARGSGRTYRMIMSLPENALVVTYESTDWIKHMIRDLRGPSFKVRLASCRGIEGLYQEMADRHIVPGRDFVALDHHLIYQLYAQHIRHMRRQLNELGVSWPPSSEFTGRPPPVGQFMDEARRLGEDHG